MNTLEQALRFHKYSALGNHFCIIDETEGPLMDEKEKLFFAQEYASPEFGIGCDSVLVIQPPDPWTFSHLEGRFGEMWLGHGVYPEVQALIAGNCHKAHAVVRIFEPCGQESAMCGNGIRCVADYLYRKWNLKTLSIIAEVTTPSPRLYHVERCGPFHYRIRMENPRPLPEQFKGPRFNQLALPVHESAEVLDIPLPGRLADMAGTDILRCFVTYTGEPHLVCFTATRSATRDRLRLPPGQLRDFFTRTENFRTNLITAVADHLNERGEGGSPCGIINPAEGINVSIAEPRETGATLDMRVYERGIWGSTKACGTGATAVASLAIQLGLVETNQATILSEGSFYHNQGSYHMPGYVRRCGEMTIKKRDGSWFLQGPAEYIFSGRIDHWREALLYRRRHVKLYSYNNHMSQENQLHDPAYRRELAV